MYFHFQIFINYFNGHPLLYYICLFMFSEILPITNLHLTDVSQIRHVSIMAVSSINCVPHDHIEF